MTNNKALYTLSFATFKITLGAKIMLLDQETLIG